MEIKDSIATEELSNLKKDIGKEIFYLLFLVAACIVPVELTIDTLSGDVEKWIIIVLPIMCTINTLGCILLIGAIFFVFYCDIKKYRGLKESAKKQKTISIEERIENIEIEIQRLKNQLKMLQESENNNDKK